MQILDGGVWESNYNDENRGEFQFENRARQVISFKGMKYGKITPTDIDALIEFHGKAMILYEVKYNGAEVNLKGGQWKALKELADMGDRDGKCSILIVCDHYVANTDESPNLAECKVRWIYYKGKRYRYRNEKTVKEITDKIMEKVGGEKAC